MSPIHNRKSAISFIFVTMLIDCIGFGLLIPVTPRLISGLTNASLSDAAVYGGWLLGTYAAMQFVFSPVVGALSDKYGRRPILLFSLMGLGIDYLLMALAPNITWLFVGRMISGMFGASYTTAAAYIADVSEPENRAKNFGLIGMAFGIGFVLGPGIGGLLGKMNIHAPFYAAAALSLANFLYGFFILPESLDKEHRRPFEWKRANPFGAISHISRYKAVIWLLACIFVLLIASHAMQSTWTYIIYEKFKWSEDLSGYSLMFVGLLIGLVQGLLTPRVIKKFGLKNSVFIGLTMYFVGFSLFAFASQSWMMFAFLMPYCLGGFTMPAIQSIMSTQVEKNAQGELQGIVTSLMSLGAIIGPLFMTHIFHYFTDKHPGHAYYPGVPFAAGAILTTVSIVIAAVSLSHWHNPTPKEVADIASEQPETTIGH